MSTKPIVVIDTETGGLDPQKHSILSIGLVILRDGAIEDKLYMKIAEPEIIAEESALLVNGLSVQNLKETGVCPATAIGYIKNFLMKNHIYHKATMCGHNLAAFDLGFIKRLYELGGQDVFKTFSHRVLDTQILALALDYAGKLPNLRSISLDSLAARFNIRIRDDATRHDALEDAIATARVFVSLVSILKNTTSPYVAFMPTPDPNAGLPEAAAGQ